MGPGQQKRIAARERTFRPLEIVVGGGATIGCTARDVSASGAQVEVALHYSLPMRFTVIDPATGRSRLARLVWRSGNRAGIAFLESAPSENALQRLMGAFRR